MITKKTYIPGKTRNKKLTNATSGSASVGKTEFNQIAGESHVHYNKKVLDQITEAMLESMANAISELIKVDDETELSDENVMSSLRVIAEILANNEELKDVFLSKVDDDTAAGLITFLSGIIVNGDTKLEDVELESLIAEKLARLKKGAIFGEEFITGMIGGKGARLSEDENGKSILEIDKITAREEFIVPKITFNNIDVISGDQAATFAFGTIKNVDTEERTFELDLLEGEFGTLHQNDILRGVFHNLTGGNVEHDSTDTNGFLSYSGFATSYFSPSQILINEAGEMKVKYFLQPGTTMHPINGMNFFAYGNFTDTDRQGMTYQNRLYTRRLKNQDTWDIVPTRNIAYQDGLLEGLVIGGMEMHGYGTFSENNYMTGANIQFTPSQLDELRGKSSFSVSLSSYERVVKIDEDGIHGMHDELNVVSGDLNVTTDGLNVITSVNNLSTRIQAFKGEDELLFAGSPETGKYSVVISEHGCTASVQGGILAIEEITNLDECYVDVNVNCEGLAVFQKRFSVSIVRDGRDGVGSVMVDLDDAMQAVLCDSDGAVLSGLPLSTVFSIYYGSALLELDSLILNAIPGVTASANKDTGVVSVTAIAQSVSDVIRLQITGKATYEGIEYTKRATLTINKLRPGADGENAVIYSLQPSVNSIYKNKNGVTDVSTISCRVKKQDGESVSFLSLLPENYSMTYSIDGADSMGYMVGSNIPVSSITRKIVFYLRKTAQIVTIIDAETIYILEDGTDGTDGEDGHSPYIGANGNWWVWSDAQNKYVDSGDPAKGDDGKSPYIGANGNWLAWNGTSWYDTGIRAKAEDGKDGKYTELRYKYAFSKPATPTGINPPGWNLSNENNKITPTRTGDFIEDGEYRSSPTQANSSTKKDRLNFTTTKPNQILTLEVFVSSEANYDFGVVTLLDTAYATGGSYTWRKSGVVKETIEILVPTAGSHFIEIVYAKDSSGVGNDDKMRYRVVYPFTCWLIMTIVDPNTNTTTGWSEPVYFPTDTPDKEQIYLLAKSDIVADMPSSDPYKDEYIGEAPEYDSSKNYVRGNIVKYNSGYKINITACKSIAPSNSLYWEDVMWWTDDPGGISSEYPYEYECERSFTNVWGDYGKYRLFMRYPKDGEDGETPVVYQLIPSVSQIGKTMTGSYEPSSFTVYHRDSKGVAVIASMAVLGSNNGSTWTQIGVAENVSSKVINVASYPFKYYLIRTYTLTSFPAPDEVEYSSPYLLSVSVNVLQDGEDGAAGARGAMPVYCGYYKSGTAYTYTNETRDIINYDFSGQPFTFQVKNHGASVTTPPTSSTGDANWEVANKYSFVAMDTALIDGANIAEFMFKDSKMISRMGTVDDVEYDIKNVPSGRIGDFIPYASINGNTGEIMGERILAGGLRTRLRMAYSNSPYEISAILSNGYSINLSPPTGTSFPADFAWYDIILPNSKSLSGMTLMIHAPMASLKRYRIKPGHINGLFYVDEPVKVATVLYVVPGVRDTIELKAVWDEVSGTLDWHVISRVSYRIADSLRVPSVFKEGDIIAKGDVSDSSGFSNLTNRYMRSLTCTVSSGRFTFFVPNPQYFSESGVLQDGILGIHYMDLEVSPNNSTFRNAYIYKEYSSLTGLTFYVEFRTYNGSSAVATAFRFVLRATDYIINSNFLNITPYG